MRLPCLAVPCILTKRALSLLIHKNQSDKSDKVELWNTVYMAAAVEQLKKKATPFRTAISHKSGLRATPISISMDTITSISRRLNNGKGYVVYVTPTSCLP